jgi:acyl-CoA hydrolase
VDLALEKVGPRLVIGTPLGLGKPLQMLNAFYRRVADDPSLSLTIYTALSLEVPTPSSPVEAALAAPILERLFGDYEGPAYLPALKRGELPDNITVSELYFKAGDMKTVPGAQQQYISSNYTHIARDMFDRGVNVLCQMLAFRDDPTGLRLSLSSNPDTAMDLLQRLRSERPDSCCVLGQLHPDMPFMENDAEVAPGLFDALLRNADYDRRLFAVPNAAVPETDYATALHASSLVRDGGTLQIGIGALGDAVARSLILREQDNTAYRSLIDAMSAAETRELRSTGRFSQGLYVSTEMFVNGMLHLIDAGVVKRRVYDDLALQQGLNSGEISEIVDARLYDYAAESGLLPPRLDAGSLQRLQRFGIADESVSLRDDGNALVISGKIHDNDTNSAATRKALLAAVAGRPLRGGVLLHGGFFLGPADFYQRLRDLDPTLRAALCMTSVLRTNQLLQNPPLYIAQRRDARFINTGMMVSLAGAVTSDGLEDGTVISGVGGQYNFVSMAHDLPGARSVLCIRATRGHGDKLVSNIVPFHGHVTIPRHLRDIVVTEYGIADLRGQSDSEVIKRLLAICDSRFQLPLMQFAKNAGKLEDSFAIPEHWRQNTPKRIAAQLREARDRGLLPDYPFGCDMTEREQQLAASLRRIKALSGEPAHFLARSVRALLHHADAQAAQPFLERIHLEHPHTSREFLIQQLLLLDLEERGLLKVS